MQRCYSIDLYRFMFTIVVCLLHFELPYFGVQMHFETGYLAVEFFFILSGFLLSEKIINNKDIDKKNIIIDTYSYIFRKIRSYYLFYLYALVILFIYNFKNIPANELANNYHYCFWEISLLQSIGFPINIINVPMWYFSALLIVSFFIYFMYSKNRAWYIGFIAPLTIVIVYTAFSRIYGNLDVWGAWAKTTLLINTSLPRAFAGVSLGCCSNYIYNYLKKLSINKLPMLTLNIIEIVSIIITYLLLINNVHSSRDFIVLPIFSILIIT